MFGAYTPPRDFFLALGLAAFVVEAWAFIDAVGRPAQAFVATGKQTKQLWLIILGVAAVVWSKTRRARAILLPLLALVGSPVLVHLVKMVVHRPTPPADEMLAGAPRFAFPSTQATVSAACLLTAAFVAWGVLPSWRSKVLAVASALSVSMLVGLVGLALGVHWLTDVLGGWALGLLWFAIVAVVGDVAATIHHRQPAAVRPPARAPANR